MPHFSWRKRPTRHFGEVWVPFAQVDIRNRTGRYQAFAMQVDSGATVSLLRRSVAALLGIELETGRRIGLTTIGGAVTTAYVHHLDIRFTPRFELRAPFAIADVEAVPNLLGRLGLFDELRIDFDGPSRETRITAPWLDSN